MTVAVGLSDSAIFVVDHEFSVLVLADLAPLGDGFDFPVEIRGSAACATRFDIPAACRCWCDVNGFTWHFFFLAVDFAEALEHS